MGLKKIAMWLKKVGPFRKDIVPFAYRGRRKHALKAANARLVDMALGPRLLEKELLILCMDHLTPGKFNDIVATSNVANIMKKDTDEDEWHAYFRMLDAAMQGGTFDKTTLKFK